MTTMLCLALCSAASGGVTETNYQQIDPETAIVVDGFFPASHLRSGPYVKGQVTLGTQLAVKNEMELGIKAGAGDFPTIAILSDEDLCGFGAHVKIDTGGVRNSVEVTFRFITREGELVDQEVRFPAGGTTRQSFSSENFQSRFAGIEIHAGRGSKLGIGFIRLLPCALAIS